MEYTSFIVGFKVRNLGNYLVQLVDFVQSRILAGCGRFESPKVAKVTIIRI
jgi:hypothetical protein